MNYKKLKFRCGLEIHQQLENSKLFCNCPSLINDEVDIEIKRKLRIVESELGEIDKAAEFEKSRDRDFVYIGSSESNCLVELDEEPIHNINQEALDIALEISLLLKAEIVDEVQVMRKIVLDGSNTSGFQRTMLIGRNGYIETSKGKVKIPIICLEEDAAKKIRESKQTVIYRLDRLGIALIEIATDDSIKDNKHAKEVASKIGMILRSTGKVKKGIGSIRQDVNVSIKDGKRVEIKGFQDLRNMDKVIENEVKRQLKGNVKEEVRGVNPDNSTSFLRPMPGSARMYPETDIKSIKIDEKRLRKIKLPELIDEKAINLEKKYEINSELAHNLVKEDKVNLFEKILDHRINANFLADTLISLPKVLRRDYKIEKKFKDEFYERIFNYVKEERISKDSLIDVFIDEANNKFDVKKYEIVNDDKILEEIEKLDKNLSFGAMMGEIMKKFKGRVDGKRVSELLRKVF